MCRSAAVFVLFAACAIGRALAGDEVHDQENAETRQLQQIDQAIPRWLRDKTGRPDWVRLLDGGFINPRDSLRGDKGPGMSVLEMDVVMKNTKQMPWVRFPHRAHTQWLECSNCHDAIFVARAGGNRMDMNRIFRGEYCGACHGRVAFSPMVACERCHSIPQGNVPAWWLNK
jgi:c(7)-type cytochrome triheme protein